VWIKLIKFFAKYILPIIIWLSIIILDNFMPFYKGYLTVIAFFGLLNYYVVIYFLNFRRKKESNLSLYMWLDNLEGSNQLLKFLLKNEKEEGILNNLEKVHEKVKNYCENDKKKLKLLRSYFKTINEEGPLELLNKTILGIIVASAVWLITKGKLWSFASFTDYVISVDPIFITFLNFITFIIEGFLFLVVFIVDHFKDRTRNKIILEVIDVCIDELD
jgi:hypothetical protein